MQWWPLLDVLGRCSAAWKMKKSLDTPPRSLATSSPSTGHSCEIRLAQDRLLHHCSLVFAPNVVVRCRADDPRWPIFESFATVGYIEAIFILTVLRELFYQPTTTVTLQQY